MTDLGTANGWSDTPELVRECEEKGHATDTRIIGRCLREISCEICGYTYKVDSSD